MHIKALRLCLITETFNQKFIEQAIEGGVTSVQLRDKANSFSKIKTAALALKAFLTPLNIPLIINDDVNLASIVDADGVHLGQNDLSPINARQILGANKIIGWSVESEEQLQRANQLDCIDYIGASAIFTSASKPDCKTIWGLTGLKKIVERSKYPVVAIGGINCSNIREIIIHGACGAAVISAIYNSDQPKYAANALIKAMTLGEQDV